MSGVTWGVRDELRVGGGLGIRAAGGMWMGVHGVGLMGLEAGLRVVGCSGWC